MTFFQHTKQNQKHLMYLIAIGWIYVVLMMSVAEALSTQGTVLGAVVTFVLYGLLPLSIVLYIFGTPLRRRQRLAQEAQAVQATSAETAVTTPSETPSETRSRTTPEPQSETPAETPSTSPDSRSKTAGDAVATVGKEP